MWSELEAHFVLIKHPMDTKYKINKRRNGTLIVAVSVLLHRLQVVNTGTDVKQLFFYWVVFFSTGVCDLMLLLFMRLCAAIYVV